MTVTFLLLPMLRSRGVISVPLFNVYVDVCLQVKANTEEQALARARKQFAKMLADGKVSFIVNEMYYDEPEVVEPPPPAELPPPPPAPVEKKKKPARPRKRATR